MPPNVEHSWIIESPAKSHQADGFDCGKEPLNAFIRKYAALNQHLGISRTYVAARSGGAAVEGYYCLSSGAVAFEHIPADLTRGLPKYPNPVGHLGKLAVAKHCQGKGLGEILLLDALARIAQAADLIGICAVEVFAKDDDAKRFYRKYGFTELKDDRLHLYLPMRIVRKLRLA